MKFFVLLVSAVLVLFAAFNSSPSISTNKQTSSQKPILKIDKELLESKSTFDYVMGKDLRFHLALTQEIYDIRKGIYFDSFEISKDFAKPSGGYVQYSTDFKVKPGKHTLTIDGRKIDITTIYMFDLEEHFDDIKDTWQSRNETFAKVTKDGILLKNYDRDYGSFAFKRFFSDNLYVNFDFIPVQFKPGMVVYFGDNIYFMINYNNILVMKKGLNKNKDIRIAKIEIPPIRNNILQRLEIDRKLDTYTIHLNGKKIYNNDNDNGKELREQRFKNVGISMPNNGCAILLKKIVIK